MFAWLIIPALAVITVVVMGWQFLKLFIQINVHKQVARYVPAYPDHPRKWGMTYCNVRFETEDGIGLCGWVIAPKRDQEARGVVLLLHGLGGPHDTGGKSRQLPWANVFADQGYLVLMFDFRNHGDSDSGFITFGRDELLDVRAARNFIAKSWMLSDLPVVLAGVSYGAATAIRFAATHPYSFQGVIAISGYADFSLILHERVKDQTIWGKIPGISRLVEDALCAELSISDLRQLSPCEVAVHVSPMPLLILHGTRDDIIGEHHAHLLYSAAHDPKSLVVVKDGSHGFLLDPIGSHKAACEAREAVIRFTESVSR